MLILYGYLPEEPNSGAKEKEDKNMDRVYNFSPGPSQLPLPVLEKIGRAHV